MTAKIQELLSPFNNLISLLHKFKISWAAMDKLRTELERQCAAMDQEPKGDLRERVEIQVLLTTTELERWCTATERKPKYELRERVEIQVLPIIVVRFKSSSNSWTMTLLLEFMDNDFLERIHIPMSSPSLNSLARSLPD